MGCVTSMSTLSDEELDRIAKSTDNSRQEIQRQYEQFLKNNPDGKVSKWNFRKSTRNHDNGFQHQMFSMRRTPVVSTIYGRPVEEIDKSNWL